MILEPRLQKQVDQHPYPLVFATISGAHLYGFPSADSARPIVGAIRWDAWYGRGSPVSEVEKTLGPKKDHFRLPFFAKVVSPAAVSIDGDSQQEPGQRDHRLRLE